MSGAPSQNSVRQLNPFSTESSAPSSLTPSSDPRVGQIQSELNDPGVDVATRMQVSQGLSGDYGSSGGGTGYNSAGLDNLLSILAQDKAGTGIYAVRQMDQTQKNLATTYPGRTLLSPSAGQAAPKIGSFF